MNNNTGTGHGGGVMFHTKKRTQGRKKIEMKKIKENSQLQVTFSKRRYGLFKKASELCVLTGAEIAIIVNSPGKRMYAFGHPNVDVVVDKYLAGISYLAGDTKPCLPMRDFNEQYYEILRDLEAEKEQKEMILHSKENVQQSNVWWNESIEGLDLEELELYIASMEELKNNVLVRADELKMIKSSSLVFDDNNNIEAHRNHLLMIDYAGNPVVVPHDFHQHGHAQI